MTPVQRAKTWYDRLGVWMAVITFVMGWAINWGSTVITQGNRLDLLTQKVADMDVSVNKLSDRISRQSPRLNNHEVRISVIENVLKIPPRPVVATVGNMAFAVADR